VVIIVGLASYGAWLTYNILGPKPDFKLQPIQSFQKTFTEDRADFTVRVTSLNNFTGIVTVSTQGPNVSSGAESVLLGSSVDERISVTSNVAGNYTLTVIGQSGRMFHSITLLLIVQGVSVTFNPLTIDVTRDPTTSTVTMVSQNSFSGYISLGAKANICDSCSTTVSP